MNVKQQSVVGKWFKTYIVDALSFMAMGLFCSLILGLIIKQIALIPGLGLLWKLGQGRACILFHGRLSSLQ